MESVVEQVWGFVSVLPKRDQFLTRESPSRKVMDDTKDMPWARLGFIVNRAPDPPRMKKAALQLN